MLLFGSIAPSQPAGQNFWQFDTNQTPLINIDKATGATGLFATSVSQEPFVIVTDNFFGSGTKISALADNKNPNANESGIVALFDDSANGGDRGLFQLLATTQEEHTIQLSETYKIGIGSKQLGSNKKSVRNQDYQSITETVNDNNSNASQHNQNPNIQAFNFFNPTNGAQKASYEMDETETRVKDGAGIKTFAVLKDGSIQTNQAQPHDNTINVLTWNVPIYDTTGTLLGYLRLYNP